MLRYKEREAKWGTKMIEVNLRFWTDGIAKKGKIRPRECWESGVIRMTRNPSHRIVPRSPVPFNTMNEILPKIEQVLRNYGIRVHRMKTAKGLYV